MTHALIGAALLLAPLLSQVPLAVISGLFLYLGVTSLGGNTFAQRLGLCFSDPLPDSPLTRRVAPSTIRTYTLIQLACLACLWRVKSSRYGIVFPIIIAALVPARLLVETLSLVSAEDLEVLDGDGDLSE